MRRLGLRRLITVLGITAIGAGGSLVMFAPAAQAADPFPAGATTFTISGTFAFSAGNPPSQVPTPFTGQMKGTSDGAGTITFPKADVSFPVVNTTLSLSGLSVPAIITVTPTTNWTGTIDTATGVVTLKGTLMSAINLTSLANVCPLGPITLDASTTQSGGAKYKMSGKTATATVIDRLFRRPGGARSHHGMHAREYSQQRRARSGSAHREG